MRLSRARGIASAMEIDFPLRTRGRAARQIAASVVRELDQGDLGLLSVEKGAAQPQALKRLGERHHALARNLSAGMKPGDAARIAGLCPSRVSILQADPAFRELMSFYRDDVTAQYRDLHQRLSGLALDAADELAQRLEDEPEKVSVGQLMEVVKMGADRTGYGPQSSSTNINVNVDLANRMKMARERVAQRKTLLIANDTDI